MKTFVILLFIVVMYILMFGFRFSITTKPIECITPTLTGEYGQPDGWETLTGPYVE